jgi:opine dehydrogenase
MGYKFGIIGAGNGGQAMAAYFKLAGNEVKLYDNFSEVIDKINDRGFITLEGAVTGDAYIDLVTSDFSEAVKDVDVIMVVNPSIYHKNIAQKLAPYIKPGHVIFLNPANTFGAFAFKKALEDNGCYEDVVIAESNTLLFACRALEPGLVNVGGKKDRLLVSAFPANKIGEIEKTIAPTISEIELCETVLETSFDSTNAMVHPLPSLMNASWIESGSKFKYYYDGIGPTVGAFIDRMDKERIEAGKLLGLELGKNLFSLYMEYAIEYDAHGDTIDEVVSNVKAYKDIYSSDNVKSRYIYEDVPMGLVPFAEIEELIGIKADNTRLVVDLCEKVLNEDFSKCENCRNLVNLGLEGMSAAQIIEYAKTGKK